MNAIKLLLFIITLTISTPIFSQNLADKVVGEYKGRLKNQSMDQTHYKIKIIKVSANKVKIQPLNGNLSHTFTVDLFEEKIGTIQVIKFKYLTDHILNNGMYVEQNKRLTYAVHLGGSDMSDLEVFSGERQ